MSDEIILDEEGNEVTLPVVEDQNENLDHEDDSLDSGEEDSRLANNTEADTELNGAETDEERESIRERRRQERHNRKQAQRHREETLRRELSARDSIINELRQKVDLIERRNTGSEAAQLENAKKQVAQSYNFFKDQIRVATEAGNGAAVAEATEKMIQSQRKFDELAGYERSLKQQQNTPQPLDPRLANQAESWMKRNSWYDPGAKDQDSGIVLTLDQRLASEGWDPTTKEYWDELDSRVKKYLPHRAIRGKISDTKPRSVVTGSGREASNPQSGTFKLSAERVQALKDAGIWDDPKQRAEAAKRFREYDKQNQS